MSAILEVRDVHHWFGQRKVLDGIHFKVGEGETLVIMGGSGCGKSTLLRILIGLLQPSKGEVLLFGEDMARASDAQKNNLRKKFGMLFQGAALFNSLTVAENIALPIREHTKLGLDIIQMIGQVKLELVGLSGFGDYKPYEISGGMKKRVGLA
ncbi:MAG: ATP-binding cassette domain-containing protein, partial [Candidatus Omnitrophica bacterium]|nr:ATP-binding cassette domain-containing protein [Candidatus Omnitrophota bacterium]